MPATKTPLRAKIRQLLAELNDQLQFFLLAEAEFIRSLDPYRSDLDAYTTDVLAHNQYAARIRVTLRKLPHFQATNRSFTLGAYFSTAYEVASGVFAGAQDLLAETNSGTLQVPPRRREGPEEFFERLLLSSSYPAPPRDLIGVFTYCRLRRNSFIHLGSAAGAGLHRFVATRGTSMNRYWAHARDVLDFSQPPTGQFTEDEVIVLIKLLRVGVQRIDSLVAPIVDPIGAVAYVARRQFAGQSVKINNQVIRLRARKLVRKTMQEFGFIPTDAVAAQQAASFGVM